MTGPVVWRILKPAYALPVGALTALALFLVLLHGPAGPRAAGQDTRLAVSYPPDDPFPMPPEFQGVQLLKQTAGEAAAKSAGCVSCHQNTRDPHFRETLNIGCTDCHGGDATKFTKEEGHVQPLIPGAWPTSANPQRSYTLLNHEKPEFIRFVNPGDFRIAHISCGTAGCHPNEVHTNRKQIMATGCMLWGAALYNNGAIPVKRSRYGEAYGMYGQPLRLISNPPPTKEEVERKGVVPYLDPLPRYEISQPGNLLRIFERGGRFRIDIGIPEKLEDPGKPRTRLSDRGLGTQNRTDPVFIGLQKTRLLNPMLYMLGTNDHPGDYRSSGCTSCHVVYANDRSPVHSGPYAKYGHRGTSFSGDPTIPKDESGHPIQHRFVNGMPTSQCIVCHTHPGTTVMNSYLGYMWWDEETDGEHMYPAEGKKLTAEQVVQAAMLNPDAAAARGLWSDPKFLENVVELNPKLRHTQFADFHGHGWVYRAVYKKDRHGGLLDHNGKAVQPVTTQKLMQAVEMPNRLKEDYRSEEDRAKQHPPIGRCKSGDRDNLPVHMLDIHIEKGMHCVDCHFVQDVHGNGRLHQEVRAAVEIQCVDCHGTVTEHATLRTSGPASYTSDGGSGKGRNLAAMRTPSGKKRFEWKGDKLYQNSVVDPGLSWEVVQTKDTIDPASAKYNEKSALAKTVRFDDKGKLAWGDLPYGTDGKPTDHGCAHQHSNMSCIACHSSWNPSCFGCHLPQKANYKMPQLTNLGDNTRNYTEYNYQTLRDDVFMIARDGDATGNRVNPSRSSCAIHVGSYNGNRESIYVQQQTISAEGLSGIAFSTNVPHTVRGGPARDKHGRSVHPESFLPGRNETKQCTDCHVSKGNDNNAIMAQLLMHGTGYVNFIGRYAWVATGEHGIAVPVVTERDEPQSVIGSFQHKLAYPEEYKKHVENHQELEHFIEHPGKDISDVVLHPKRKHEVLMVQNRGEYLYGACGEGGLRVFDIAFIDNKAFSERMTTAPVSPIGQRFYVPMKYCTYVATPTTLAPDPTRTHRPENKEAAVGLFYGFLYCADKYEGLVVVGVGTTINGNPLDNFLYRQLTFNPDGLLNGAKYIAPVGTYLYVCCDAGLVVIDMADPTKPKVKKVLGEEWVKHPNCVQFQFRYGFVTDEEGVKVLDVTDLANPQPLSKLDLKHCHSIYLARTYAYVAAGKHGLVILDIEKPEKPKVDQVFTADGCINDLHDVKLGITYVSEFAYLADGKNGFRVVQLTSPETPGNDGFSPRPTPKLIATFKIPHEGHALYVARGLDRDRAVDESGNQIAVFGRVGARPLNADEQKKMYLRDGKVWKVSDDPRDPMYHLIRRAPVPGR